MANMLKDKKIEIYNITYDMDGTGNQIPQRTRLGGGALWTHYRHLSGNEIFAAAQVSHTEESVFTVNWRADIKPGQIIVFKGEKHEITRVDDYEGYKTDLRLYTKRV